MKRILSLDGGGIRGHFSIQVLHRVESLLRERTGDPHYLLRDHFDLIVGTSTGAIIGALLAWGHSVEEIDTLYRKYSKDFFRERRFPDPDEGTFEQEPIEQILQDAFRERDGSLASLGSPRLREQGDCCLMIIAMQRDTLQPWVLSNHPEAPANDPARPDCNLHIPLWQVLCGSAAVPPYYRSQLVEIDPSKPPIAFLDGGLSGYNNPAALAVRMATMPQYGMNWKMHRKKLFVLSVGTSDPDTCRSGDDAPWMGSAVPKALRRALVQNFEIVRNINRAVDALIASSTLDQDAVCRSMAHTLYGQSISRDLLTMGAVDSDGLSPEDRDRDAPPPAPSPRLFSYTRYQKTFSREELDRYKKEDITFWITDAGSQDALIEIGREFASYAVKPAHLL